MTTSMGMLLHTYIITRQRLAHLNYMKCQYNDDTVLTWWLLSSLLHALREASDEGSDMPQ